MTVESNPLAAHVSSKSGNKKKKALDSVNASFDSELKEKSFISDQTPRSLKDFESPLIEIIDQMVSDQALPVQ
jgi:hypothetical protein